MRIERSSCECAAARIRLYEVLELGAVQKRTERHKRCRQLFLHAQLFPLGKHLEESGNDFLQVAAIVLVGSDKMFGEDSIDPSLMEPS